MSWRLSVIVCLLLLCSSTCLASTGLASGGPEQSEEEASPRAAGVGEDCGLPLVLANLSRSDVRAAFRSLDGNSDGFISPAELYKTLNDALLCQHGLQMTRTTLADKIFKVMDSNIDGKVSFGELTEYAKRKTSQQDMQRLFKSVDLNGNGVVSKAELTTMYQKVGIEVKVDSKFDALFRAVDASGDGKLSYAEFAAGQFLPPGTW